jgi:cyclopropane-fatty-acyl-phospholipid synthase
MSVAIELAERGLLPDSLTRYGIRSLLRARLDEGTRHPDRSAAFVASLHQAPVAIEQQAANEQHYEVPPPFYELVLGPRLKYSSCWFEKGDETLGEAEEAMLALTCQRAGLRDGMRILEIGCGWGSLTLWMAEHFPASRIIAVSNSAPQRRFIEARAAARGLTNIEIHTADITTWQPPQAGFDRVVSVECFEHLRNYAELFRRIRSWLQPDGALFTHVFCHRDQAYPFETAGSDNWMGRHFFTGGIMPSEDLFSRFNEHLQVAESWRVNGRHYARTSRLWLDNLDADRIAVERTLLPGLGAAGARRQAERWRMFFMACEELFAYRGGEEWFVTHQLLKPR